MKVTFQRLHQDVDNFGLKESPRCSIHTVVELAPWFFDHRSRDQRVVPRPFPLAFYDETMEPVCDLCVAEGVLDGSVDVVNPDTLLEPFQMRPGCQYEVEGVTAAREALGRWGEVPRLAFLRAIESLERRGELAVLLQRLFDIRHESTDLGGTAEQASDRSTEESGGHPGPRRPKVSVLRKLGWRR